VSRSGLCRPGYGFLKETISSTLLQSECPELALLCQWSDHLNVRCWRNPTRGSEPVGHSGWAQQQPSFGCMPRARKVRARAESGSAAEPPPAVPRGRGNMQYPVLQFPLLHCLARMLGHGKRHRGLQSRSLRSGPTLPAIGRTPWLIARRGESCHSSPAPSRPVDVGHLGRVRPCKFMERQPRAPPASPVRPYSLHSPIPAFRSGLLSR
jgi:hypothetical protein